jgi:hypothetical protein
VSTLVIVLCLALLVCVVVGALAVTAVLLIHVWRWARRTDTYEPASSETPEEAAWRDVQQILAADVPSELEVELYDAIRRHREGEDVTVGAPRERP